MTEVQVQETNPSGPDAWCHKPGHGSGSWKSDFCPHCDADRWRARAESAEAKLNTPELHDFSKAVALEAAHQRARWGAEHDAGKTPADWFWLLGYLSGKALQAAVKGDREKALHHTVSTAAALANWHAALLGADTSMRPGISDEKQRLIDGEQRL